MILISIGTNPSNRITYDGKNPKFKYVSGYHAELILKDDGSIYLTDKGSTNGTTLNGKKIEPEVDVFVNRGDKITFANVVDLDWNKIPVLPTIDPREWDLYSIGTNLNNRIQLTDITKTASRFHATIKINKKTGKIYITDNSANGTFVKGQRLPANQETQIKWKDEVTFANNIPLDWNRMNKPSNASLKPIAMIAASVAAVLIFAIGIWQMNGIKNLFVGKSSWNEYQTATVLIQHDFYYDVIFDDETFGQLTFGVVNSGDSKILEYEIAGINENIIPNSISGTGFIISEDGRIVTNKHIAEPWEYMDLEQKEKLRQSVSKFLTNYQSAAFSALLSVANENNIGDINARLRRISNLNVKEIRGKSVTLRIGYYNRYYQSLSEFEPCKALKSSSRNDIDLAIIQINKKTIPKEHVKKVIDVTNVEANVKKLKVGDKLTTFGYPNGLPFNNRNDEDGLKPTQKSGELQRDPSDISFDIDAEIQGGASGSPVFNNKKELVGVINSRYTIANTSGKGILAKHITKLLEETK